jgi:surface polysaccharide O-acyltransferase-like enzyme
MEKIMETKRKFWIDNLRWVTVLLVLLYHVIYFYNNKGVFGGVGGFGNGPQYQDVLMYILYPWFMPLLFILAGISSRYALENRDGKTWFKSRTRKLLVPATIGLFVFQWMVGYFNTHVSGTDVLAAVPQPFKYLIWSVNGIGPLWFIQDLWLFSLILLIIRKIDKNDKLLNWCGKLGEMKSGMVVIILLVLLFWLGEKTLIMNPRAQSADGLYNLYKPAFYFIVFMMGYLVFSHEKVLELLEKFWAPMMIFAAIAGAVLIIKTFGQNNTTPQYMASPLNCLYGYLMCLALMGWFKAKFDKTNAFAGYMTRSSFGFYIVHYLVIASIGYMMKYHTTLPPVAMYLILTVAVFALSPAIYEIIRRIPFLRWAILGEKK